MVLLARVLCQAQAGSIRGGHVLAVVGKHVCVKILLEDQKASSAYMNLDQEGTLHRGRLTRLRQNIAVIIVDAMKFLSVTFIPPI